VPPDLKKKAVSALLRKERYKRNAAGCDSYSKINYTDIHKPQVGLGKRSMGVGPETGQLCEPLRRRRIRRNEACPEGGTVDIATDAIFGAQAAAGLTPSLRRVLAGWRANAHRPAMALAGVLRSPSTEKTISISAREVSTGASWTTVIPFLLAVAQWLMKRLPKRMMVLLRITVER
jgi:hypothetical protein